MGLGNDDLKMRLQNYTGYRYAIACDSNSNAIRLGSTLFRYR